MSFKLLKQLDQQEISGWKSNRKFPLLFIVTSAGKTRVWACWVIGNIVYRTDGFINGKLKEPQKHAYEGNTLRQGPEQAVLEAEKLWLKQVDRGYAPASDDKKGQEIYVHVMEQKSENGGMNRGVRLFGETAITTKTTAGKKDLTIQHRPMLAKKYKDWKKIGEDEIFELTNPGKAIKFPAIAQAKVDGIRGLMTLQKNGDVLIESRNGNSFVHLNHIRDEIRDLLQNTKHSNVVLDGEMYIHILYRDDAGNPVLDYTENEMKGVERYQFISEACKITRSKPHPFETLVEYWVFDIWDPNKTNTERRKLLNDIFADYKGDVIKLVPTRQVNNHDEIEEFMAELVGETNDREGYEFEGLMVRQAKAKYAASTTHQSCLLKYKRFEDEEWEVAGAERCDGGLQDGAIKWICKKTIKGREKSVVAKQTGDSEESKKLYTAFKKNPKKFLGKMLNIRFNDRTKDGVPRFPRATAFVEDKD